MTRKDYILLASACEEAIIDIGGQGWRLNGGHVKGAEMVIRSIADKLADDNARFDRPLFLKAAGI